MVTIELQMKRRGHSIIFIYSMVNRTAYDIFMYSRVTDEKERRATITNISRFIHSQNKVDNLIKNWPFTITKSIVFFPLK